MKKSPEIEGLKEENKKKNRLIVSVITENLTMKLKVNHRKNR